MTKIPRAGIGLCAVVTLVAITFIFAGLEPISHPQAIVERLLYDVESTPLRTTLGLTIFFGLTALLGGVLTLAWNRIACALFDEVGEMRVTDGYVIAMLLMFL